MAEPNIVLKDQTGNSGTYEGIDMIKIPGHNADGIVEEILFKKYVEGASDGKIKMTSGCFYPNNSKTIISAAVGSYSFTLGNNVWKKTFDASDNEYLYEAKLVADDRWYYLNYLGWSMHKAIARTNFSSYGNCITVGNPAIATHNYDDQKSGEALIIYQPSTNKTTILATVSAGIVNNGGMTTQMNSHIELTDMSSCEGSFRIKHGGTTKPDAIFVIQALPTASEDVPGNYSALWGFKSSFAHLIPNNRVVGTYGLFGGSSDAYPIELGNDDSIYLYCPDEETFATPRGTWVFTPTYSVYWFAFWGLTDETT